MKDKDILIVDDGKDLAEITCDILLDNGFSVAYCTAGKDALEIIEKTSFKLIILDINLPDSLGFDVCQRIRLTFNIPIIFISARTSDTDKVTELDIRGDDYIPKSYSLVELLVRVKARIRRSYTMDKIEVNQFIVDDICVDFSKRKVKVGNQLYRR